MITDQIMDAIDMMIDLCDDENQILGMISLREMLADFDDSQWLRFDSPSACNEWLAEYLNCKPTSKEEN